jgi:hypothetical protein
MGQKAHQGLIQSLINQKRKLKAPKEVTVEGRKEEIPRTKRFITTKNLWKEAKILKT